MEYDKEGGTTIKKKVLIIDDDLDICREIKYALQSETTDAFYALSATDGLLQFTKNQFCLIIMDIQLSEIDGLFLLESQDALTEHVKYERERTPMKVTCA